MSPQKNRVSESPWTTEAASWLLCGIVILIPLVLSVSTSDTYGMPKLTAMHVLSIAIGALWLMESAGSGSLRFRRSSIDLPMATFLLVVLVAVFTSVNRYQSFFGDFSRYDGFLTYLDYAFLFWAGVRFTRDERHLRRIFYAAFGTCILVAGYGIAQHFGQDFFVMEGGADVTRAFSTLGNPVFLGSYLTLFIPLALGWMLYDRSPGRYVAATAAGLSLPCLVYTFSRAAWFGTAFGIVLLAVLLALLSRTGRVKGVSFQPVLIFSVVALLIFGLGAGQLFGGSQMQRVISETKGLTGSTSTRLLTWKSTMVMVKARPLLGWGPDTFPLIYPRYESAKQIRIEGRNVMTDRAHNELLQVSSGMGLIGLAAYLWIYLALGWLLWKRLWRLGGTEAAFAAGAFSALAAYFLQMQFSFSLVAVAPVFWTISGTLAHSPRDDAEKNGQVSVALPLPEAARPWATGTAVIAAIAFAVLTMRPYFAEIAYRDGIDVNRANGDPRLAIMDFERALAVSPRQEYKIGLAVALKRLGTAARDKAAFDRAEAVLKEATATDLHERFAFLNLGDVYLARASTLNEPAYADKAIATYMDGLKRDPHLVLAMKNIGDAYSFKGDAERSRLWYEKAVSLDAGFSDAWNALGVHYGKKGDIGTALKMLEKAMTADPGSASARSNLGLAYFKASSAEKDKAKRGELYAKAVESFKKAYELNPGDAQIVQALKQLGVSLPQQNGQPQPAATP